MMMSCDCFILARDDLDVKCKSSKSQFPFNYFHYKLLAYRMMLKTLNWSRSSFRGMNCRLFAGKYVSKCNYKISKLRYVCFSWQLYAEKKHIRKKELCYGHLNISYFLQQYISPSLLLSPTAPPRPPPSVVSVWYVPSWTLNFPCSSLARVAA